MGRIAKTKVKKTDLQRIKYIASAVIQYGIELKTLAQKIESENTVAEELEAT